MKYVLLSVVIVFFLLPHNPWSSSPEGVFVNAKSVGIGTKAPAHKLHIASDSPDGSETDIVSGIPALASPFSQANLFLRNANGTVGNSTAVMALNSTGSAVAAINFINAGHGRYPNNGGGIAFATYDGSGGAGTTKVYIQPNGNVGIGTTTAKTALVVNGTITTKEVVTSPGVWADYVFHSGYSAPSLDETESFIRAHGRLPGIPSEQEVRENGVSMGAMQSKLLAKIEELTLQMIAQEKENRELRERISRLEAAFPNTGESEGRPGSGAPKRP